MTRQVSMQEAPLCLRCEVDGKVLKARQIHPSNEQELEKICLALRWLI